ncbi:MAG: hypothetical protein N4A64_05885 [Marinisporobacter sp.]|jgi:hypothetical protein|nr:hypothetical protein [Marinisporobacter sp.]
MELKKYEMEIDFIFQKLTDLENGNFYEVKRKPGFASAKTYARNLKDNFIDLLDKINHEKKSMHEELEDFYL